MKIFPTLLMAVLIIGMAGITPATAEVITAAPGGETCVGEETFLFSDDAGASVTADDVTIFANKPTLVRNNDFTVTITGQPNEYYVLWVKGTSGINAPNSAPFIKSGQYQVYFAGTTEGDNAGNYQFLAGQPVSADVSVADVEKNSYAMVELSYSGSRTVGFDTDETTKDQTYTIGADHYPADATQIQPAGTVVADSPTYATVKVRVETGDITVTTSGDSQYYIGQEFVISGANTDSDTTWLFITGPGLPSKGGSIEAPWDGVNSAAYGTPSFPNGSLDSGAPWTGTNVKADDTWEYRLDTKNLPLNEGSYTIWAVTTATNMDDLGKNDAIYGTVSIVLKQPFVVAATSSASIAQGDDLHIIGNAEGDPTQGVAIWIIGNNYVSYTTETVAENGAFGYTLSGTSDLETGQYFVLVQHPMINDQFDVAPQKNNPAVGQTAVVRPVLDAHLATPAGLLPPVFLIEGEGSLQGANAVTAFTNTINSAGIDDTYFKLSFMVREPLTIDPIGDTHVGETFSITGSTNLAVGTNLMVNITSVLNTTSSGSSGIVPVMAGETEGANVWEFAVDTSAFTPGDYTVTVTGVGTAEMATQTFSVMRVNQNRGISITAPGNDSYLIGNQLFFSGTNTDSDTTWLFVSGPNLPSAGGSIELPHSGVNSATDANGTPVSPFSPNGCLDSGEAWEGVSVAVDNTWECMWDTGGADLDEGTYTVYAVTTATDKNDIESHAAKYSIADVTLKKPYLTANISSSVVAKGDDLYITGSAEGNPTPGVAIWVLGWNYLSYTTGSVGENNTFSYPLANTKDLATGQYFVVVQHPMKNDLFDIAPQENNPAPGGIAAVRPVLDAHLATPEGLLPILFTIKDWWGRIRGSSVATTLVNAINSPDIDDISCRFSFTVRNPAILIGAIGDRYVGETFSIRGTTNLAIGDTLTVNISSTQNSTCPGASGMIPVMAGETEGANVWEFAVDASSFTPGDYQVEVKCVKAAETATQSFTVLKEMPPTPKPTPTPVPTPQPTCDVTRSVSPGWNLVSTPVDTPVITATGFLYENAYAYNTTTGAYEPVPLTDIVPGEGYWVGAFTDGEMTFTGVPLTEYQKNISSGWNMIGGVGIATQTGNIRANHGAAHPGQAYCYSTGEHAYRQASVLEPGVGYWLSSTVPCNISLNITPPVAPV